MECLILVNGIRDGLRLTILNNTLNNSESVKIAKVQNLYERSNRIHGYEIDTSPSAEVEIVKKYLENRGITFDKSTASSDLKASILFDTQTRENYPAFTAFARNSKGENYRSTGRISKFGRR
ncbi:putative conjugative transfer protein TraI [Orientia tsutsugamushi str. Gilliam]|uniref:Putative conjugative transfer protein TraI n=1 Tax=Orientia tsutsugamushi str. Gilliam TaxID=1359184 RepID=A0A0F3M508_ORITS|nr:putative conjugative transfer protein TraI [Orientia tsutsugamushi str. Gilliam]